MSNEATNPHSKWLRAAAEEIGKAGHAGWGNTCSFAAEEVDRLASENKELEQLLCEAQGAMKLFDEGLDEMDGEEYQSASKAWDMTLARIDAILAKHKEQKP
jgi:hypothetical protein